MLLAEDGTGEGVASAEGAVRQAAGAPPDFFVTGIQVPAIVPGGVYIVQITMNHVGKPLGVGRAGADYRGDRAALPDDQPPVILNPDLGRTLLFGYFLPGPVEGATLQDAGHLSQGASA
jgi:hypothetical protein